MSCKYKKRWKEKHYSLAGKGLSEESVQIGASKQHIMHIVRRETLNWCKLAIPMGEVLAVLGTLGICAFLSFRIGGKSASIPTGEVSMIGILCGVMVGIITVLLADHASAKRDSKVSPMAAVTGNSKEMKRVHSAARTKLWKVDTALGIHHATVSRKYPICRM